MRAKLLLRQKLTDEKRMIRVYGSEVVLANLTGDPSKMQLHVINYGKRPIEGLRLRVRGSYTLQRVSNYDAAESKVEDFVKRDGGTEFTIPAGQLVNGNTVTSVTLTSAGTVATATVAGSPYAITPSAAVGTGLGNYTISYHNAAIGLTVNKAHLTVTAVDKSKTYDAAPFTAFTATITGFKNGETVAVVSGSATYTGSAVGATLPGTYTITPQVGTLNAANYDFPGPSPGTYFVNGTLTIGYGTCTGPNPGGVILPPINADGTSVWKVGSTVPVKFTVCGADGQPISDPNAVFASGYGSITLINTVRGTVNNVNETTYNDIPDSAFRWSSGIWIFNMATANLQKNNTYQYRIALKNGDFVYFTAGTK